jgi:hypothetical protein
MARKMVGLVATINKTGFSGRQLVACWTCHRGCDRPVTTPEMDRVYGMAILERDDVVTPVEFGKTAEQVVIGI